jgi:hypoxanthine phosphoribosyltransferase
MMDNTQNAPVLEITHQVFLDAIDNLVRQIGTNHGFTCVTAVPNGGIVPAVYLANKLNLPIKNIDGCFRDDDKILFVEDVVDTGNTLNWLTTENILTGEDAVATIVYKLWSTHRPEFWAINTDKWVVFEWENK